MQVGSAAFHGHAQQVIDIHAGGTPGTVAIITRTVPADEMTEVTAPLGRGGRADNKKAAPKGGWIRSWKQVNLSAGLRLTRLPSTARRNFRRRLPAPSTPSDA